MSAAPIREKSLNGIPKPWVSIERTCVRCGAGFVSSHMENGGDGMTGIWWADGMQWCCSEECAVARGWR